jgi:sulfatase modifying factor 1
VGMRHWAAGIVAAACLAAATVRADPLTYEMVTVGNPNNIADLSGYGSVGYEYRIGRYDVTIGQYAAFLTAVAATSDPYGLYNPSMGTDLNVAGITRTLLSGTYTYTVMNNGGDSANRPITYVSWFDAARFANWMSNGQGSGSTETGAYTLGGQTSGVAPSRNYGASYTLPTRDEWYKAAYFSQDKDGVNMPGYWLYGTQSSSTPGSVIGSPSAANWKASTGYSVTQSSTYSVSQNYLTDVGAFVSSASHYGAYDMSGNVFQWNDLDGTPSVNRDLRGGSWENYQSQFLSSYGGGPGLATMEGPKFGFRLAGPSSTPVPEIDPAGMGSVLALVAGALGVLERRRARALRPAPARRLPAPSRPVTAA